MGIKQIIYTEHALNRMLTRGITKEMVKAAVFNPERIGTGYKSRSIAYRSFGNKRIKVVYSEEGERYFIMSAMWD